MIWDLSRPSSVENEVRKNWLEGNLQAWLTSLELHSIRLCDREITKVACPTFFSWKKLSKNLSLSSEDHLFGTTKIQSPTCPLHKIVILKIEVVLSLEYVSGSVVFCFGFFILLVILI